MVRARTIGSGTTRPLAGVWAVAAVAPGGAQPPPTSRRSRPSGFPATRPMTGGGGAPRGRPMGPRSSARLRRGRLVVPVPVRGSRSGHTLSAPLRGPGHRRGRVAQRDAHPALGEHVRRDVRLTCAAFSAPTTSSILRFHALGPLLAVRRPRPTWRTASGRPPTTPLAPHHASRAHPRLVSAGGAGRALAADPARVARVHFASKRPTCTSSSMATMGS